jgi:dTDP-4-dehydrorhamnose reductase
MKKLLITGASGFLGGHIFSQAQSQFDLLGTYWNTDPQKPNACWARADLLNFDVMYNLLHAFNPDIIIHAAANSNLDDCEKNKENAYLLNVAATRGLAEYCAEKHVRFIFVSSDMVFDGKNGMYTEEQNTSPISYYGETKVNAEGIVKNVCPDHVIARSALIYGKSIEGGPSFSQWIEDKLADGERASLYVNQYRTPIYVGNLAKVLLELSHNDFIGTLHLGGANKINRYDFGKQLCKAGGYNMDLLDPSLMDNSNTVAPRPKDISLSIVRANKTLQTKLLSTEQGLLLMYEK